MLHRRRSMRNRDGSVIVVAVLMTAILGLSGVMVSRQLERDLARQVRVASDGRELEPLVEAAIEDAHHQLMLGAKSDPVAFLREGGSAVTLVPSVAADGMDRSMGVELSAVEAEVVDRKVGAWQEDRSALPTLFTKLRTTWGVLELRAKAKWPRFRGPTVVRRLTVRRLFTVVDHVFDTGEPKGYAHLFPGAIASVMEAE
jgi:hypothetical protein